MAIPNSLRRTLRASPWLIISGVVIAFFLLTAYLRVWYRDRTLQQEITRLQEEAERLRERRLQTNELLRYVQTPAFVEAKARTDLNLARPGEQVAVIERVNQSEEKKFPPAVAIISNPRRWWRYFTGN